MNQCPQENTVNWNDWCQVLHAKTGKSCKPNLVACLTGISLFFFFNDHSSIVNMTRILVTGSSMMYTGKSTNKRSCIIYQVIVHMSKSAKVKM